jgi:nucleotide-binding universal stress UspA family protein
MQTIITPTDFSDISLNAVNYAADMAVALNASLLVLHAQELPLTLKFSSVPDYDENAEEKLCKLKQELTIRTKNKIKINSKQVPGIIENELIKMCEYKNPLAVVMATHGASLQKLLFVESITVYLSRNLKYPVIIVPEGKKFKPVHKILLATDLKDIDHLPIEKIISIITGFNATLDIVHVSKIAEKSHSKSAEVWALNEYLKSLYPHFHFITNDNIQEGILHFAEKHNADMILTFPKKHTFFHKSESKKFIFNSPVTVITIQ